MFMAPPMALLPYIDDAGPLTTSILSTSAGSIRFQLTEPPSDLLTGTPSIMTSTLACSLPLRPRMVTFDLCEMIPNERLMLSPGTVDNISSTVVTGLDSIAAELIRVTRAGTSAMRLAPRLAVTITAPASMNSSSSRKVTLLVAPSLTFTLTFRVMYPSILASRVWVPADTLSIMNLPSLPVVTPLVPSSITATSCSGRLSAPPVTIPVMVP